MHLDLHNHTTLCNHATGSVEQYIKKAEQIGIDIYGFACHAPMEYDKAYRMRFEDMDTYFSMIEEARRTSSIEVLSALEVDFIKGRSDLLDKRVLNAKVDYLIGSVHFIDCADLPEEENLWGFDNPAFISQYLKVDIKKAWELYYEANIALAKSRLFDIIGHVDLLKIFGHHCPISLTYKAEEMLQAIKDADMVIEINSAGLRKDVKEQYPSAQILSIAHKMNIPITFSSDAHALEQIGYGYDIAKNLATNIGYTKCAVFRNRERSLVEF